jgi:hypothetical protein
MIGFVLAIILGAFAGLMYGWLIQPPAARNTELSSLRSDYKTDYVLMVARAYPEPADASAALIQLKELEPTNPLGAIQSALLSAQQLGYSEIDLRALAALETRINALSGVVGQ